MNDVCNKDVQLTEEDFAVADEVLHFAEFSQFADLDTRRQKIAQLYATVGPIRFRVYAGLREPANPGQALETDFHYGRISQDEFLVGFNAYVNRPCDETMLKARIGETNTRLHIYSQFMLTLDGIVRSQPDCSDDHAERGIRAMSRKMELYSAEIKTVNEFLTQARVTLNRPLPVLNALMQPSAVELVSTTLDKATALWRCCEKKVADDVRKYGNRTLNPQGRMFYNFCLNQFAMPRDLQTLVREELAIGLNALGQITSSVAISPNATFADPSLAGASLKDSLSHAKASVPATRGPAVPMLTVKSWSELAIGIDEHGELWLLTPSPEIGSIFSKSKASHIRPPGKKLLQMLELVAKSQSGQSARLAEIVQVFCLRPPANSVPREPRGHRRAVRDGITEGLSRGPNLIRDQSRRLVADLGNRLREIVAGPKGKGVSAFQLTGDEVRCGFVVQFLVSDGDSGYTFGPNRHG